MTPDIKGPIKRLLQTGAICSGPCVNDENRGYIRDFHDAVHISDEYFERLDDPLGGTRDMVLATHDRYGLPITTVLNLDSGLIRSDPYYTDEAIGILYKTFYRKIYECSFGMPATPKSALVRGQIDRGISVLDKIRHQIKGGSRILDYGCGIGGSLLPFKEAGHTVLGVDYGDEYLNYGKEMGIPLRQGGLEQLEGEEPFDLIILSHVLEHLKEPVTFLESLKEKLAEDGLIYIEVPALSWVHRIWNHDLLLHLQNAHAWYFTPLTLRTLLAKANLEVQQQYGAISVLAKAVDITTTTLSPSHATTCLSYLNRNEFFRTNAGLLSRIPRAATERLFNRFKEV